jgi:hypothetical protein
MKTKRIALGLAGILIASASIITSCKKSTTTPAPTPDSDTQAASDHSTAENSSNDISAIGSQSIDNGGLSTYKLGGDGLLTPESGTVTITPNLSAKTVTVTFSSFLGKDGHLRNGTLLYDYSATTNNAIHYRDSGLVINVSTPGNTYSVDGDFIEITSKTISNKGRITSGNMTWNVSANIKIVKANNGGTVTWNATRTHVLLNTNATTYNGSAIAAAYSGPSVPINWAQALIAVTTGSSSGTTAAGESFSSNISHQLVRNFNCSPDANHPFRHPFVEGTINFTPGTKATRTIDFGTGTCDLDYTVTINGNVYHLTLP